MRSFLSLLSAMSIALTCVGQVNLNQVLIAEGGTFGTPGNLVKFGSYDPVNQSYLQFDSVAGDFTTVAFAIDSFGFLHAGSSDANFDRIYKYHTGCFTLLDSASLPGVQEIESYDGQLLMTFGFGSTGDYFRIYDQDFGLIQSFPEVAERSSALAVADDKAYVGLFGAWPNYTDSGKVAIIDLFTNTYERTITLDTNAKVVEQVFADGNWMYTIASERVLTKYDLSVDTFKHYPIASISNAFAFQSGLIYAEINGELSTIDPANGQVASLSINQTIVDARRDSLSGKLFLLDTDFFSQSSLTVIDQNGNQLDQVNTLAPSASAIALSYGQTISSPVAENFAIHLDLALGDTTIDLFGHSGACPKYAANLVSGPLVIGANASIVDGNRFHYQAAIGIVTSDTVWYSLCNAGGTCDTAQIVIRIGNPVGIDAAIHGQSIEIYPNPADQHINLSLESGAIAELKFIALSGKMVKSMKFSSHVGSSVLMQVDELSPGSYVIHVVAADGSTSQGFLQIMR